MISKFFLGAACNVYCGKPSLTRVFPILAVLSMRKSIQVLASSPNPVTPQNGYCSSYSSSCGSSKGFTSLGDASGSSYKEPNTNGGHYSDASSEELKERLSPLQYSVTREAGTERAFTGKWYDHKEPGTYTCVVCGSKLFGSESKYDSGSGWPSFHSVFGDGQGVTVVRDASLGMVRDEVRCAKCGSHMGHVFDDGPPPTGLRYCVNSASLDFAPEE